MTVANIPPSLQDFAHELCTDALGAPMGKVERKFVQSMLAGMSKARSVNLTEIAKGLDENISLHATHKRLSRNLYDVDLARNLAARLLKMGSARVGEETRLIVHVYELKKRFAQKIEYLPKSDDLSRSSFKVCEIIASELDEKAYFPLFTHVWSEQVPGYVSDAREVLQTVQTVLAATDNRGILFLDDYSVGVEETKLILSDRSLDYTLLVHDRDLTVRYRDADHSVADMLGRIDTRYGKILYKLVPVGVLGSSETDLDLFLHAGCAVVKLPLSGRAVNFVALKTKSSLFKESATPLLTTKTNLRSRKALMGLVDSFLSMQDVIATHCSLRDSFNPENFRVLTYHRLQLLLTLLESVIYYEVSVKGEDLQVDETFAPKPHQGQLQRTYLLPDAYMKG